MDVVGVIKRITDAHSKDFTGKKGPFTVWSIGILMDNGEWYNIKAFEKQKAEALLQSDQLKRSWKVGDEVKMFLEAEDDAAKYWKIVSIAPSSPMDEVEVEDIVDAEETDHAENANAKAVEEKVITPEEKKEMDDKKPVKDMKKVSDYKSTEADKYELGMAKNNAAIIFAAMIPTGDPVKAKEFIKEEAKYYTTLTKALYEKGRMLREELLGY